MEDIQQELAIAWCVARDKWKAEFNVPFSAYLMRGMKQHIRGWMSRELNQHHLVSFGLDDEMASGDTHHDTTADPSAITAEEALIEKDLRSFAHDRLRMRDMRKALSDSALQFLDLLDNPPEELVEILQGLRSRGEFARQAGVPVTPVPSGINAALVFDLMGCSRQERTRIYKEIRNFSTELSQQ